MHEYKTKGTCSSQINFEVTDGKVHSVSFSDGCDGNLKALSILVEGMEAADVVKKLKGLPCGKRKTSCSDQLAQAIEQAAAQ
ncbi:MAG: TIGR03905 family TSCPD domain-containing protein [Treponema sp.]|nr:TIGR03905 family TSCPD domain-containing protein [Treponema sp.]